jgi:hypothetical protein
VACVLPPQTGNLLPLWATRNGDLSREVECPLRRRSGGHLRTEVADDDGVMFMFPEAVGLMVENRRRNLDAADRRRRRAGAGVSTRQRIDGITAPPRPRRFRLLALARRFRPADAA